MYAVVAKFEAASQGAQGRRGHGAELARSLVRRARSDSPSARQRCVLLE